MARGLNKLSAQGGRDTHQAGAAFGRRRAVLNVSTDGETTRRRWVFLFRWDGKLKEMGLGGLDSVPLARARELAATCGSTWPASGIRSIRGGGTRGRGSRRRHPCRTRQGEDVRGNRRRSMADKGRESNAKTVYQWHQSLEVYAAPLRDTPVAEIKTEHVLDTLKPIWRTYPSRRAALADVSRRF